MCIVHLSTTLCASSHLRENEGCPLQLTDPCIELIPLLRLSAACVAWTMARGAKPFGNARCENPTDTVRSQAMALRCQATARSACSTWCRAPARHSSHTHLSARSPSIISPRQLQLPHRARAERRSEAHAEHGAHGGYTRTHLFCTRTSGRTCPRPSAAAACTPCKTLHTGCSVPWRCAPPRRVIALVGGRTPASNKRCDRLRDMTRTTPSSCRVLCWTPWCRARCRRCERHPSTCPGTRAWPASSHLLRQPQRPSSLHSRTLAPQTLTVDLKAPQVTIERSRQRACFAHATLRSRLRLFRGALSPADQSPPLPGGHQRAPPIRRGAHVAGIGFARAWPHSSPAPTWLSCRRSLSEHLGGLGSAWQGDGAGVCTYIWCTPSATAPGTANAAGARRSGPCAEVVPPYCGA